MQRQHLLFALAGLALAAAPAEAHRVHAGVTEVNVNPRTAEMEVVHRLFAHDLMQALGRDDQETEAYFGSAEGKAEIGAYAGRLFRLGTREGALIELDYVGAEADGEFAWIYFTAPPPDVSGGLLVDNDLLADQFDDQVMMTNLRFDSQVRTAMQGPGQRAPRRLEFD